MFIGFLVGVIVGFVINENWSKILSFLEQSIQKLQNKKK